MSNILRLGHRLDRSEIYGPGIRSVFWTQGCTLACKGAGIPNIGQVVVEKKSVFQLYFLN